MVNGEGRGQDPEGDPAEAQNQSLSVVLAMHDPAWTPRAVACGTAIVTASDLAVFFALKILNTHAPRSLSMIFFGPFERDLLAIGMIIVAVAFAAPRTEWGNEIRRWLFGTTITILILTALGISFALFLHSTPGAF